MPSSQPLTGSTRPSETGLTVRLRLFASLREQLGVSDESLALPNTVTDVATLITHLRSRGASWDQALGPRAVFRVAVDQHMATTDTLLHPGAEVALFPPVTGG